MEEKAKLSFVTTRVPGVFALKLSKHLPMNDWYENGDKLFEEMQSGWVVQVRDVGQNERLYEIQADCTDNVCFSTTLQANEYDVILVRRNHISVVDEQIYLESYDAQSAAINRKEYEHLKHLAMKGGM